MPDNMGFFREPMFRNASVTGAAQNDGAGDRMLTPNSVKESEKAAALTAALENLLAEAEKRGEVSRKDPVFCELIAFFISKANTQDGKERALRMAISVSRRLHNVFEFTPKKNG